MPKVVFDLISALGAVSLLAADDLSVKSAAGWADLIERYGIMALLLIYFVIRDYVRSKADAARQAKLEALLDAKDAHYSELEKYVRTTMAGAMSDVALALQSNGTAFNYFTEGMKTRQCLATLVEAHDVAMKVSGGRPHTPVPGHVQHPKT